jgi:hypothetical protein
MVNCWRAIFVRKVGDAFLEGFALWKELPERRMATVEGFASV